MIPNQFKEIPCPKEYKEPPSSYKFLEYAVSIEGTFKLTKTNEKDSGMGDENGDEVERIDDIG